MTIMKKEDQAITTVTIMKRADLQAILKEITTMTIMKRENVQAIFLMMETEKITIETEEEIVMIIMIKM